MQMPKMTSRQCLVAAGTGLAAVLYPTLEWLRTREPESSVAPLEGNLRELPDMSSKSMAESRITGLSLALITQSGTVWSRGVGVRNTATKQPVTPETVFEAGSLAKAAFACAVLNLAQLDIGSRAN